MSCIALFLGMPCDLLLKNGHLKKHPPLLVFPDWLGRPSVVNKILSFLLESAQGEGISSPQIFSGHVSSLGLYVPFFKNSLVFMTVFKCLNFSESHPSFSLGA